VIATAAFSSSVAAASLTVFGVATPPLLLVPVPSAAASSCVLSVLSARLRVCLSLNRLASSLKPHSGAGVGGVSGVQCSATASTN
jgi:hypothetical protein